MSWSNLAQSLPEQPGPAREKALLSAVRENLFVHAWAPLVVESQGRVVELEVSEDALMVGEEGDAVLIPRRYRPGDDVVGGGGPRRLGWSPCTSPPTTSRSPTRAAPSSTA